MGWMGMTDNLGEGISGRNSLSAEVCKLVENGSFWRKDEWKIAIDCEMMEKKQVALESSEVVGVEKPSQEANNSWLKDFSIRFYGWQLANKMYGLQLHHICLVKSWLSPQFMAWVKVWKTITSSIRLWGFMHDYPEQRRLAGQELSNPFIAMLLLKIIWFNQFIVSHSVFGFIQRTIKAHSDPVYKDLHSSSTTDSEVSNDSNCSKSCMETVKLLKFQNDQLLRDLEKSSLMVLVPPPYTGNFMPPTPDFSFTGLDEFVNEPVVENIKAMSSKEEPKAVRKNDDAPIIE
ncbi:hypothetical protein Tco_0916760 [Tanacetum coccineum]